MKKFIKGWILGIIELLVIGLAIMLMLNWYEVFPHINYWQSISIAVVISVSESIRQIFNKIKTKITTTADFSIEELTKILVEKLEITSGVSRIEVITESGEYDYDDRYQTPDIFKGVRIINEK